MAYQKLSTHDDSDLIFAYISVCICLIGIVANVFMAIVLNRASSCSTVNRLLTCSTVLDTLLMCSCLIYLSHFKLAEPICPVELLTYQWVVFQLIHSNLSVYLRACALWLSVITVGYRTNVVSKNVPMSRLENLPFVIRVCSTVCGLILLICVPIFLQNTVIEGDRAPADDQTCPFNHSAYFMLYTPDYALKNDAFLLKLAYWINGVCLKLFPCLVLCYYVIRLLAIICRRRKRQLRRRREFMSTVVQCDFINNNNDSTALSQLMIPNNSIVSNSSRRSNSTTSTTNNNNTSRRIFNSPTSLILITILSTTICCEIPNAVLSVMSGLMPADFLKDVYAKLGDIMDMLSLVNCATTSCLYFCMSRTLRGELWHFLTRVRSVSDRR